MHWHNCYSWPLLPPITYSCVVLEQWFKMLCLLPLLLHAAFHNLPSLPCTPWTAWYSAAGGYLWAGRMNNWMTCSESIKAVRQRRGVLSYGSLEAKVWDTKVRMVVWVWWCYLGASRCRWRSSNPVKWRTDGQPQFWVQGISDSTGNCGTINDCYERSSPQ